LVSFYKTIEIELPKIKNSLPSKQKTVHSALSLSTLVRDQGQPTYHLAPHIHLRVIVEYHHFTPFPWLRRKERVTEFTPDPLSPHARRRPYMHSAKEDKRQDHWGYQ
jgi:hypothetical protein